MNKLSEMKKTNYYLKEYTKDKIFLLTIILFSAYFIYRLIDQFQMINYFNFNLNNDGYSYMAMLKFLSTYGFHGLVPDWYNGFVLFSTYPPGTFFFLLPFYKITPHLELLFYITLIFLYILGFIILYNFSKINNLSLIKKIAFFCIYFLNPIAISHNIRMVRITALLGTIIMLTLFLLVYKNKEKELSIKFIILFSILYFLLLITHQPEFILFNIFLIGFFITRNKSNKLKIFYACLIGIALASFWLVPFIKYSSFLDIKNYSAYLGIFEGYTFSSQLTNFILPISLLILFILYYKINKLTKKEILFYLPILILALAHALRITIFIPIIKYLYGAPYSVFFSFFIVYFLLQINLKKADRLIKVIIIICIIFGSLVTPILGFIFTEKFSLPSEFDNDMIDTMQKINGKYMIIGNLPNGSSAKIFYTYGSIYLNVSTADGWSPQHITKDYKNRLFETEEAYKSGNCTNFKDRLKEMHVTNIITTDPGCLTTKKCGFKRLYKKNNICLETI